MDLFLDKTLCVMAHANDARSRYPRENSIPVESNFYSTAEVNQRASPEFCLSLREEAGLKCRRVYQRAAGPAAPRASAVMDSGFAMPSNGPSVDMDNVCRGTWFEPSRRWHTLRPEMSEAEVLTPFLLSIFQSCCKKRISGLFCGKHLSFFRLYSRF